MASATLSESVETVAVDMEAAVSTELLRWKVTLFLRAALVISAVEADRAETVSAAEQLLDCLLCEEQKILRRLAVFKLAKRSLFCLRSSCTAEDLLWVSTSDNCRWSIASTGSKKRGSERHKLCLLLGDNGIAEAAASGSRGM